MTARSLQPSELEIQREVEALRDIRRRSTTPGALTIDPDLPNQSPTSPTSSYWASSVISAASSVKVIPASSIPSHDSPLSSDLADPSSSTSSPPQDSNIDDPLHLFWVPASVHPEIAPAEFRAFLKEHARTPGGDASALDRSSSLSGLGRKKSMLSRQYKPSENDGLEDENVLSLKRTRSNLSLSNRAPQLTISDLQKLEELAEEAAESDDPSRLRSILRRSLSMNMSPTAIAKMDNLSDMPDEADAPIIVPLPGQIVRRAARTKIRKPGLPGDGNGHRFGARRGVSARAAVPTNTEARTSSDRSSSDHSEDAVGRYRSFSNEGLPTPRPDSFSEEASSIFDAYARDDSEEGHSVAVISPPEPAPIELPHAVQSEAPTSLLEALGPVIEQPDPQQSELLTPHSHSDASSQISRTPSPEMSTPLTLEPQDTSPPQFVPPQPPLQQPRSEQQPIPPASIPPQFQQPSQQPFTVAPPSTLTPLQQQQQQHLQQQQQQQRKDKDKKGIFKWGKPAKEKADKETGFFSWFGGAKKKQDQESSLGAGGSAGREAAQALLGASKSSKNYIPPTSAGLAPPIGDSYARYPIHVERAIYRLSHIKLANPRRPLYEQVLISNLMFWYLGVINKAQNSPPPTNNSSANGAGSIAPTSEAEKIEKEQREKEQERMEKERQEKERLEREQRERDKETEVKKKESGRRGSLTKTPAGGAGRRAAEMPVKGPSYEMQHRVMEQEYNGYSGQGQSGMPLMNRSTSAPAGINGNQQYQRGPQPYNNLTKIMQPQPVSQDNYYYSSDGQSQLPPGAMPPMDQAQWSQSQQRSSSPPSGSGGARRSRSPPHQNPNQSLRYGNNGSQENLALGGVGGRTPGRSLSATAVPPQVNGKPRQPPPQLKRPRTSEGRPEPNGVGEEEDVPLALWQQQRRR
ncbi:hypothetical protein BDN72DRAFT_957926 [Pluteus cervinus]|uniref:Uncharacterized protein n=1 Tax=Pluteus cervinus TaxID=181527 RepID=A0ACD3B1B5_9AGAR|nr:hypothetical protein BDN72DRAFT_957926 [Pluteus cervinus]